MSKVRPDVGDIVVIEDIEYVVVSRDFQKKEILLQEMEDEQILN